MYLPVLNNISPLPLLSQAKFSNELHTTFKLQHTQLFTWKLHTLLQTHLKLTYFRWHNIITWILCCQHLIISKLEEKAGLLIFKILTQYLCFLLVKTYGLVLIEYIKQLSITENELHGQDPPLQYSSHLLGLWRCKTESGGSKDKGYYAVYAHQIVYVRLVTSL